MRYWFLSKLPIGTLIGGVFRGVRDRRKWLTLIVSYVEVLVRKAVALQTDDIVYDLTIHILCRAKINVVIITVYPLAFLYQTESIDFQNCALGYGESFNNLDLEHGRFFNELSLLFLLLYLKELLLLLQLQGKGSFINLLRGGISLFLLGKLLSGGSCRLGVFSVLLRVAIRSLLFISNFNNGISSVSAATCWLLLLLFLLFLLLVGLLNDRVLLL
jgi:hypothetical protein